MDLLSLKRHFMAAFPVIGPHSDIEPELMLSGKKPLTWMVVMSDNMVSKDRRLQKEHEGRKQLDEAVENGTLIASDVTYTDPRFPEYVHTLRHYAQPTQTDQLRRVVEFNKCALNRQDLSPVMLDKDAGHYLGYRKRDIFFFTHIVNQKWLPGKLKDLIIDLNAPFQKAHREKMLIESGYDLQAWRDKWFAKDSPSV